MKRRSKLQTRAERYLATGPGDPQRLEPLRRDQLGRLIFPDGSYLIINAAGSANCGRYDEGEWLAQEVSAASLGRQDRLARRRMRREYLAATATYPWRICDAYRSGFFEIPDWK